MNTMQTFARWLLPLLLAAASASAARADAVDDAVHAVQHRWEQVTYEAPQAARQQLLEELAADAQKLSTRYPDRAEPLVWEGIVVSSLAGEKGGLGALGLAKRARACYEKAIGIDDRALDGSAYNSLGVLYYRVPGWPIGFGDRKKADELIRKALAINPDGIDPNYFYGDFLLSAGRPAEALPYLQRALVAPPRPGREIADKGRRAEAAALQEKARSQM
jgi:tetratricopeptide (TPR) repeat protein